MKYVEAFGRFWWDFLIGDDWGIAACVIVLLPLTALIAHRGNATFAAAVLVVAVLTTGAIALARAAR